MGSIFDKNTIKSKLLDTTNRYILKPIWFSVLPETKSWLQLSPDKRRRGLYSLNFISDFIRKPLWD